MHPKSIKNDLKKGLVFRGGKVSKITKIRGIFKMGPQASKMSPRASKITQNHENMVTQNQENPRKRLQEMARWRVMRAAHWILL